jgi:hypothetical protein
MVRGTFNGVVHGNRIELERQLGLPDGQSVRVLVETTESPITDSGGLERSFGGWKADSELVDEFLLEVRRDRDATVRSEPSP